MQTIKPGQRSEQTGYGTKGIVVKMLLYFGNAFDRYIILEVSDRPYPSPDQRREKIRNK